jgi:hypothetical protein
MDLFFSGLSRLTLRTKSSLRKGRSQIYLQRNEPLFWLRLSLREACGYQGTCQAVLMQFAKETFEMTIEKFVEVDKLLAVIDRLTPHSFSVDVQILRRAAEEILILRQACVAASHMIKSCSFCSDGLGTHIVSDDQRSILVCEACSRSSKYILLLEGESRQANFIRMYSKIKEGKVASEDTSISQKTLGF